MTTRHDPPEPGPDGLYPHGDPALAAAGWRVPAPTPDYGYPARHAEPAVPRLYDAALVAAGGWCAPSEALYFPLGQSTLPEAGTVESAALAAARYHLVMPRGGLTFDVDQTPEERAAGEALRAQGARAAEEVARRRDEVIRAAVAVAAEHGWDVHVHRHPDRGWRTTNADVDTVRIVGRVGIRYEPAAYDVPTLHWHDEDASWTDDDDWLEP